MKGIQSALINLPNVYINGSPTMTSDFVASGFSADNYLTIPASLATNTGTEYVICVITGNDITGDQPFAQASTYVDMSIYEGDLSFYTWSNSTHNTIGVASPNTKYWIKEVVNGTSKSYSYSTDGINYSTPVVKTDTTQTVPTSFTLGVQSVFDHIFTGSIDLKECYIKTGGNIVWRGVTQGRNIKAVYVPSKTYRQWRVDGKDYVYYTSNYPPNVGDVVYEYNSSTQTMTPIDTVKGYYPQIQMYAWGNNGPYTTSPTPQVGDYTFMFPEIIYLSGYSSIITGVGDDYIIVDDYITRQRNASSDTASQYNYMLINNNNFYFKYSGSMTIKPKRQLINQ